METETLSNVGLILTGIAIFAIGLTAGAIAMSYFVRMVDSTDFKKILNDEF